MFAFVGAGARVIAQETPAEAIIELPKFVVTDSRELPLLEAWRYAEISGFEILPNASERETQKLRDFQPFNSLVVGVASRRAASARTSPARA